MNNWTVGQIIGNYLQALQQGGVEERLKQIREETFKRMANHPNNSLTWQQIQYRLSLCGRCGKKHDEPVDEEDGD